MSDEKEVLIVGIIVILIGLYCIIASAVNWNWFFNNRRAQGFVRIFGRNGARIVYTVLGLIFAGIGIFVMIMA